MPQGKYAVRLLGAEAHGAEGLGAGGAVGRPHHQRARSGQAENRAGPAVLPKHLETCTQPRVRAPVGSHTAVSEAW